MPLRSTQYDLPGRSFPIVGVGGSAGAIDAFRQLLRNLPPETGMGFVYIQHLDPTHSSILAEIFGRETTMKVLEAAAGASVNPNEVHVIPPNANLTIHRGQLVVTRRTLPPGHHLPIDDFMRSLAEEHPSRGVAVVLSGASSDGALGLVAVKQSGGITFAQDDSAEHSTMPHHAINTGAVDFILSPSEIGAELGRIAHHAYFRGTRGNRTDGFQKDDDAIFAKILELVAAARSVDFSSYRDTTLKRRVARRMSVCRIERLEDYAALLAHNFAEIDALVNEMLIKVTSFFRDAEMYRTLADTIFAEVIGSRWPDEEIRVWVPACATGEEAYSLAMALIEWRSAHSVESPIRIFGTDLSQQAIDHARRGMYVENICMDVSPERLSRFFHHVEDHYHINKAVRDMCVFARHDITRDPPFSKMDLASCRNLLIYMSPPLQRAVMERLHYSLNPGGALILGGSESILGHADLFSAMEKSHRIFRKAQAAAPPARLRSHALPGTPRKPEARVRGDADAATIREADRVAVSESDHSGAVIEGDGRILQLRGNVGRFLAPSDGAGLDLLQMVTDELRLPLRAALRRCGETAEPVHTELIQIKTPGGYAEVQLDVLPLKLPGAAKHYLVLFLQGPDVAREDTPPPGDAREILRLQQQLTATTDYLQSLIEELKASHEEVLSNNEELQSVNEEIETGKEELQSGNEELATVNEQLQASNVSLNQANADLRNLIASVAFPIIVLGRDLTIRMFTPAAARVFNFIQSDIGRDIGHMRSNLEITDLPAIIRGSVEEDRADEMEVADRDGTWYLMRVTPSRDRDTSLEVVIITLIDIGNRKRAEGERERLVSQLRREQTQLAQLVEHMPSALIVAEANSGRIILVNANTARLFGSGAIETGQCIFDLQLSGLRTDGSAYAVDEWPLRRALRHGEVVKDETIDLVKPDGSHVSVRANATVIRDEAGAPAVGLALFDEITDLDALRNRLAQTEQIAQLQRLETIGRLAGGVAHDFNNLLTVIIGFSQFVRDDRALSPHLASQMDTVLQSANRAATLTSQLLAFSRRQPIQLREIDLNATVGRAAGMLQRLVPEQIELHLELAPEPCMVMADSVQIEQIVMNLVSNSVDAISDQGKIVVATKRVKGQEGEAEPVWAALSVEDNGPGMSDEVRDHIFEPFFTTKEFGRGTGLGLASVFGTVKQHNGDIRVETSPGKGTRIEVLLPCVAAPQETEVVQASAPARGSETILLAEDEDGVRAMTRRCLENLGYTVIEATNGVEALRVYTEHPGVVDLLLTDVVMPQMHGGELMRKLRQMQPGIRVAFMSGYPQDVVGEHGTISDEIHFVQKPFTLEELSGVIRRALDAVRAAARN